MATSLRLCISLLAFSCFFAALLIVAPSVYAQKHPECGEWYARCNEKAQQLPGSVYDQNSAFYKAWRQCSAVATPCEFRDEGCSYSLPTLEEFFSTFPPAPVPSCSSSSSLSSSSSPSTVSSPSTSSRAPARTPSKKKGRLPKATKPQSQAISAAPGAIPTVSGVTGEVEVQVGGKGQYVPLTKGMKLQVGDVISTGYKASANLQIGDAVLDVFQITQFTIDEPLLRDKAYLQKTQVSLRVGEIMLKVKEKHAPAIRSDFSVVTPTCNASLRGSAMRVRYDKEKKVTVVYVTEDKAFVRGLTARAPVTVKAGQKVTVAADGKVGKPQKFDAQELSSSNGL